MKKIEKILKDQSSMRVVLNGGKYELEDSTIPFQIGFDLSVANLKPTHILVVDVTNEANILGRKSGAYNYDTMSERTLFKLEPIHYLQLKRPGVHHLIFILFSDINKEAWQFLFDKSWGSYDNAISYGAIEEIRINHQIAYVEAVVDVPKEFFADEPETRFQKAVYRWVNSWYKLKPVDECEYRKRKIIGFTIKPLLWFLGFIPRLIIAILLSLCVFAMKVIAFVAGWQPVSFLPSKKEMWIDFLFLYPFVEYGEVFDSDFWFGKTERGEEDTDCYGLKVIAIGKKRFYLPLTLIGLLFYSFFIFGFIILDYRLIIGDTKGHLGSILALMTFMSAVVTLSMVFITLPILKKEEEWERKWSIEIPEGKKLVYKTIKWIFFPLVTITFLSFVTPLISWNNLGQFLLEFLKYFVVILLIIGISLFLIKKLSPIISKKIDEIKKKVKSQGTIIKEERVNIDDLLKMEWLQKSFAIEKLPEKVDFKNTPQSSNVLHEFTISFWRLKAKVCKPYAKK